MKIKGKKKQSKSMGRKRSNCRKKSPCKRKSSGKRKRCRSRSPIPDKQRCLAIIKGCNKRCSNARMPGSLFCWVHQDDSNRCTDVSEAQRASIIAALRRSKDDIMDEFREMMATPKLEDPSVKYSVAWGEATRAPAKNEKVGDMWAGPPSFE